MVDTTIIAGCACVAAAFGYYLLGKFGAILALAGMGYLFFTYFPKPSRRPFDNTREVCTLFLLGRVSIQPFCHLVLYLSGKAPSSHPFQAAWQLSIKEKMYSMLCRCFIYKYMSDFTISSNLCTTTFTFIQTATNFIF